MTELLEDVLDLQDRALKASRIECARVLRLGAMRGFPVELRQVFLNLIGNAIQAMPEGGTLGVTVREATDWASGRSSIVSPSWIPESASIPRMRDGYSSRSSAPNRPRAPAWACGSAKVSCRNTTAASAPSYRQPGQHHMFPRLSAGSGTPMRPSSPALESFASRLRAASKAGHDAPLIQAVGKGRAFELSPNLECSGPLQVRNTNARGHPERQNLECYFSDKKFAHILVERVSGPTIATQSRGKRSRRTCFCFPADRGRRTCICLSSFTAIEVEGPAFRDADSCIELPRHHASLAESDLPRDFSPYLSGGSRDLQVPEYIRSIGGL